MRSLVTGGAGFIGSALVEALLLAGDEVVVVDDLSTGSAANLKAAEGRSGYRFHRVDVRDEQLADLVRDARPDVLYHLAAQASVRHSLEEPALDASINVIGSVRLLEAARAAAVAKVVYAASGGSLYDPSAPVPTSESAPRRPRTPYAVSKAVVLDYLATYRELYGLDFTALALSNVYGPRQRADAGGGAIAIFIERLLSGASCEIAGDGSQTRDFVYVTDVVDALVRAAYGASGRVLNISTGVETSVVELVALLCAATASSATPTFVAAPEQAVVRSALDPSLARAELGWQATTRLEEGLRATVAWWRTNGAAR